MFDREGPGMCDHVQPPSSHACIARWAPAGIADQLKGHPWMPLMMKVCARMALMDGAFLSQWLAPDVNYICIESKHPDRTITSKTTEAEGGGALLHCIVCASVEGSGSRPSSAALADGSLS